MMKIMLLQSQYTNLSQIVKKMVSLALLEILLTKVPHAWETFLKAINTKFSDL